MQQESGPPQSWLVAADVVGRPTPEPKQPEFMRLDSLPKFVFVPAHPGLGEAKGRVQLELFQSSSGETLVVAFSTLDVLVARLGDSQPWIRLRSSDFQRAVVGAGVPGIVIDPHEGLVPRRWSQPALQAMSDYQGV